MKKSIILFVALVIGLSCLAQQPAAKAKVKAKEVKTKAESKDIVCKVYTLKTKAKAPYDKGLGPEIKEYLKTALLSEKGQCEVAVNKKTGVTKLIITAPLYQFPFIEKAIKELDDPGFGYDKKPSTNYKMKNRLASDVLKFVKGANLSSDGAVYADDKVNVLYISDNASNFKITMEDIKSYDVPPEMVKIEAQIVEIDKNGEFDFGVDHEAYDKLLPGNVCVGAGALKPGGGCRRGGLATACVNLGGMSPRAALEVINGMIRRNKAKVLSSPTVVAVNGEESQISSMEKMGGRSSGCRGSKKPEVGVALGIKPIIGAETITLCVKADVNSLTGWGKNGAPIINTRSTTAKVVLRDGEMFALSGLKKDVISKVEKRIPFLGYIPLVGYLFRHEIDAKSSSEIVVILTPKKVTPSTGIEPADKDLLDETTDDIEKEIGFGRKFLDRFILNKY